MFVNFQLPEKVATAIKGLKPYKKEKILGIIAEKTNLLFIENSHNLYSDMQDYTSFDEIINSFIITKNDGENIEYFFEDIGLSNFYDNENTNNENNLFGGEIISPIQENIDKVAGLKITMQTDLEIYFSDKFWKVFDKEGR